ncbi:MAG: hypothetical protein K2V38_18165 [Gemmataceae bacterium]|nr:hypothetical protein [Gemmataceae bacterium]
MTMYYAVYAMRRADLGEWIVSLVSNEALARVVGWRTLEDMPWVVRCRIKKVYLNREEVFAVVTEWGRMDAARGRPISDAERLPPPFREVYLRSYCAERRGDER